MNPTIEKELREQLNRLPPEQQRQVLDFARALAIKKIHGMPGHALRRFGGAISKEDLALVARAIEEGCEQITPDEWSCRPHA